MVPEKSPMYLLYFFNVSPRLGPNGILGHPGSGAYPQNIQLGIKARGYKLESAQVP